MGLSENAFNDSIENFAVGEFQITMITHEIEKPGTEELLPIRMYSIAEKDTNKEKVKEVMNEALLQFLNRFSRFDIFQMNKELFKEFLDRFDKIFKGLIETPEESMLKQAKAAKAFERRARDSGPSHNLTRNKY
ncbi:hypothetical protein NEF87_003705 [Candidatus Lokiarchaeum ossiferum]|uniref:Uncharacterized protein n=1 Tax=Candidatus Lokiarchaeum ossiferum TaxID=2951803 RepID=A0ABY6HVI1_9ARCH|nr:hypothetical protein NEF87_003705 [Candidatus Lokiarchaeum sp. B-35]